MFGADTHVVSLAIDPPSRHPFASKAAMTARLLAIARHVAAEL